MALPPSVSATAQPGSCRTWAGTPVNDHRTSCWRRQSSMSAAPQAQLRQWGTEEVARASTQRDRDTDRALCGSHRVIYFASMKMLGRKYYIICARA